MTFSHPNRRRLQLRDWSPPNDLFHDDDADDDDDDDDDHYENV